MSQAPKWIVLVQRIPRGPFSVDEVKALLSEGLIRHNDVGVQVESDNHRINSGWKLLWQFPEFDRRLPQNQPPEKPKPVEVAPAEAPKVFPHKRVPMSADEVQRRINAQLPNELAELAISEEVARGVKKAHRDIPRQAPVDVEREVAPPRAKVEPTEMVSSEISPRPRIEMPRGLTFLFLGCLSVWGVMKMKPLQFFDGLFASHAGPESQAVQEQERRSEAHGRGERKSARRAAARTARPATTVARAPSSARLAAVARPAPAIRNEMPPQAREAERAPEPARDPAPDRDRDRDRDARPDDTRDEASAQSEGDGEEHAEKERRIPPRMAKIDGEDEIPQDQTQPNVEEEPAP